MQKITEIDLGWQKADYVSPLVCVENDDHDKDPSALSFAWFKVDTNIKPSEQEEKEKMLAMKEQFEQKVINKYGLPYGMPLPKEYKKIIEEREAAAKKGNKWERQRKRLIDRQIEKDMKKSRKQEELDFRLLQDLKSNTGVNENSVNPDVYNSLLNSVNTPISNGN